TRLARSDAQFLRSLHPANARRPPIPSSPRLAHHLILRPSGPALRTFGRAAPQGKRVLLDIHKNASDTVPCPALGADLIRLARVAAAIHMAAAARPAPAQDSGRGTQDFLGTLPSALNTHPEAHP